MCFPSGARSTFFKIFYLTSLCAVDLGTQQSSDFNLTLQAPFGPLPLSLTLYHPAVANARRATTPAPTAAPPPLPPPPRVDRHHHRRRPEVEEEEIEEEMED